MTGTSPGPTFLVAGAGRSGTTGLVEGLRGHPDVFVTRPKEPNYFAYAGRRLAFTGPGDDVNVNRASVTDKDAYLRLYAEGAGCVARGEGSVSTLYRHAEAIPEIRRTAPDVRIVVLLREPVERAQSAFDYLSQQGHETLPGLLAAVEDEQRRIADGWHHLWHYTAMSHYAESLAAYLDAFGRERVGVWFYDDLQDDYATTLRQVLRFVGTEPRPGEVGEVPVVNVSGTPRSRLLNAAIQRATTSDPLRRWGKRVTTWEMREAVRRRLLRRHGIDDDVRRVLAPVFRDDLTKLRELVPHDRQPGWLREEGA